MKVESFSEGNLEILAQRIEEYLKRHAVEVVALSHSCSISNYATKYNAILIYK